MLTTIEGVYKMGAIELSEAPVGLDEARVLVTFLPPAASTSHPKDLYGAWKTKLPESLDIVEALNEIRQESAKRLGLDQYE